MSRATLILLATCVLHLPAPVARAGEKRTEPTFKGVPLSRWLDLLDDAAADTRLEAVRAVRGICERFGGQAKSAVPALVKVAQERERRVFGRLLHEDRPMRLIALESLAAIGPDAVAAAGAGRAALRDAELGVRRAAARALLRIGEPAEAKVWLSALVEALRGEHEKLRREVRMRLEQTAGRDGKMIARRWKSSLGNRISTSEPGRLKSFEGW